MEIVLSELIFRCIPDISALKWVICKDFDAPVEEVLTHKLMYQISYRISVRPFPSPPPLTFRDFDIFNYITSFDRKSIGSSTTGGGATVVLPVHPRPEAPLAVLSKRNRTRPDTAVAA